MLVGEGGGHATLATDTAAEAGLELPALPDEIAAGVRTHLPPFAAIVRNPVEMGGISEADPRVYEKVLAPLFKWTESDALILFGGYALYDPATAAKFLRGKWDSNKDSILTAKDFIAKAATKSGTTGKPYLIRLKPGAPQVPCADYLNERLKELETAPKAR